MNQEKIGKFISECRKEKQITQEQLAVQLGITVNELFSGERLSSEIENEAKDCLMDLLTGRLYDADSGVSYEDFKNALLRMSETTVMLSKFKSKESAVRYLVKETGLTFEECSKAYDVYFNLNNVKYL